MIYIHTYLYVLEFVAHSVDLLDVGEYQLGVNPTVLRHHLHIVGSQKVGDSSKTLSGLEGKLIVGLPVAWTQLPVVEGLGEKVVDEGTEGQTISPRGGEVLNLHVIVFPGSALAPDEDSLHLRGHHLCASNSGDA